MGSHAIFSTALIFDWSMPITLPKLTPKTFLLIQLAASALRSFVINLTISSSLGAFEHSINNAENKIEAKMY